jgi:hypothetical protein
MKGKKAKTDKKIRAAALELLHDSHFLFRVGQKLEELGVTGEGKNRLTLFLAALTKDLEKPVSVLMKGPTSSGKNNVVRSIVSLLPPECVITRASLTPKALAYGSESLSGKVFYLYEYRGGRDAQYMTRELQSEGSVTHEHTVMTGKGRTTELARRSGDPVFLTTTTEEKVFADDETRFLSLRADESAELTRAVLRSKFRPTSPRAQQPSIQVWREAIRVLSEDLRGFRYPEWFTFLAERIPAAETRARRDAERFLSLLKAVAACSSLSDGRRDEKGDIQINLADYCIAYEILNEAFAFTYGGAHPHALMVAETVRKLRGDFKRPVTVKEVAEHHGWEQPLAYKWVNVAIESKLIVREAGTREKNLKRLIPRAAAESTFLPHPTLVLRDGQDAAKFVRYIHPLTGHTQTLRRIVAEEDDDA